MNTRPHERDYKDIRTHLRLDHGVEHHPMVKLSTFLRHRRLHAEGVGTPHTHVEREECKNGIRTTSGNRMCVCFRTHRWPS